MFCFCRVLQQSNFCRGGNQCYFLPVAFCTYLQEAWHCDAKLIHKHILSAYIVNEIHDWCALQVDEETLHCQTKCCKQKVKQSKEINWCHLGVQLKRRNISCFLYTAWMFYNESKNSKMLGMNCDPPFLRH